jgi:toxin ParE1/3/4
MKLVWTQRARRDLRELIAYIVQDSVRGAELVADRILKAAEMLSVMPRSGRIGRAPGTRERVVGKTPYILVYRLIPGRIHVLRVYHASRKWPNKF